MAFGEQRSSFRCYRVPVLPCCLVTSTSATTTLPLRPRRTCLAPVRRLRRAEEDTGSSTRKTGASKRASNTRCNARVAPLRDEFLREVRPLEVNPLSTIHFHLPFRVG